MNRIRLVDIKDPSVPLVSSTDTTALTRWSFNFNLTDQAKGCGYHRVDAVVNQFQQRVRIPPR